MSYPTFYVNPISELVLITFFYELYNYVYTINYLKNISVIIKLNVVYIFYKYDLLK